MPDVKKVVKGIMCCWMPDECEDCDNCPYVYGHDCCWILKDDTLALLKEQEAKPVIVTTNAYGTRFYHCPKCNRDLYVYPRQWYCSNCGQAVKWE